MMSLYGGQGMGSAGTGIGTSPMAPNGMPMNPQMMAVLQAMAGGGAMPPQAPGGVQAPPGPMQAPMTGTPMAGYIGAGGNPAAMRPMIPGQVPQPQGMQQPGAANQMANPLQQAGQTAQSMQQMQDFMNKMKAGQSGTPANLPPAQNPESTGGMMNWLQSLFSGGGGGALPPAGGMT